MAKQPRVVLTRSKAAMSTRESTHEHRQDDDGAQDIADVVNRQSFSTARHPNEKSPRLEKNTLTSILTGSWFKAKLPAPTRNRPPSSQSLAQQLSESDGLPAPQTRLSIGSLKGLPRSEEISPGTLKKVERRSSGRADPYEIPESPIKAAESWRIRKLPPRRRGPKPKPKDQPGKIAKKEVLVDPTRVSEAVEEPVELEGTGRGLAKRVMSPRSRRHSENLVMGSTAETPKRITSGANDRVPEVVEPGRQTVGTRRKPKSTKVVMETELETGEEIWGGDRDMESQEGHGQGDEEEGRELERKITTFRRNGYTRQIEGVSNILINPTPSPRNDIRPTPAQVVRAQSGVSSIDLESQGDMDSADSTLRASREIMAQSEPGYSYIDESVVKRMLSFVNEIGKDRAGERVINHEICSTLGRRMTNRVTYLRERCKNISELRSKDVMNAEKIEQECQGILHSLTRLEKMTLEVLKSKLGDRSEGGSNAKENPRQNMAMDLYMHILPGLVKVLDDMAKLDRGNEDIVRLLKLLDTLSNAALKEKIQSKSLKVYNTRQPTKKLLKVVSKLYDELMEKARIEKAQRTAPERIRKRKEQMELKAREEGERFRQRQEEINMANWISLNEVRTRLGLSPCLPEIQERASSQRPVETLGERGRSNLHPASRKRLWSKFEMGTLIEGLRKEHGEGRYERIAMELDRSVEEVVERARYFKSQMEFIHEKRQQDSPGVQIAPLEEFIQEINSSLTTVRRHTATLSRLH